MSSEVRVPALPESVADATVLMWRKAPGDSVKSGENLVDLETDKVVLEVPATADGVLGAIKSPAGTVVTANTVLATIEPAGAASSPGPSGFADPAPVDAAAGGSATSGEPLIAPAARRLVKELNLDAAQIPGTGREGRVHKSDVVAYLDSQERAAPLRDPDSAPKSPPAPPTETPTVLTPAPSLSGEAGRPEQRVPMTRLRARVAERLVEAQQNAAMLTTFNEVNLSAVMALRARYKDQFEKTHGVRLGFMSFFVKAAVEGLQRFPVINASVDGSDIIYHGYYDIGIAVSSPRGLVVPILRNCDQLSMADIEQGIVDFASKSKDGSLSFEELTGGTFSITNGGVFGSLLSTPILNPPQSAILGMHKTLERPVVEKGQIVAAPMMYLALTYDHRIIDGREAVQFLVTVKETLEDPARLLLRI
jgi:2-oxoglutarate dehydrogenase E2 component (dihydrolipoamide succinyltransferase)